MSAIELQTNVASFVNQLSRVITQTHRRASIHCLPRRIVIRPGELHRIADGYRNLRVISGRAWLTQCGRDFVLVTEQQVQLTPDRNGVLVRGLRDQVVTLELR